ncbi:MAG TPA: hypothetical protein VG474_12040, partial [Solirubrobacteraceae bacterium]|nr:hypothetical protein [Solirubrobacteraceae bacterium]
MRRLACAAAILVAGLAPAACGGDERGGSGAPTASDPFTEVSREPSLTQTARRAAPRWARVARREGSAPASHPVA